jgi:hypothetical protein
MSKSRTLIAPDTITPAITAQTIVAATVVTRTLRATTKPAGAEGGVPGATDPASPCVVRRSGRTTKNVMNQQTA